MKNFRYILVAVLMFLTVPITALSGEYIEYSPYKVLFMKDPNAWIQANPGATFPGSANNFHFYNQPDSRVEFESDGLMQFYIESGVGKDAWYGLQDGPNHRWSFGHDASDGFDFKFVGNVFGINHNAAKFIIRQNATIYPGALGTKTNPAYSFDGDADTGMYLPGSNNVALSTGGVEGLRLTHNTTQNLRLWSGLPGAGAFHVIALPEGTPPGPSNDGQIYVENGALYYRGAGGTVTKIANR